MLGGLRHPSECMKELKGLQESCETMVASINTHYRGVPSKCNLNAYLSEFQDGGTNEFFMHIS